MKFKNQFFLLLLFLCCFVRSGAQFNADTLIALPGSTVYGTHMASLDAGRRTLFPVNSPALVDGTIAETFKQIPALVTDIEGGVTYRGSNQTSMLFNGIPYGLLEEYNGDFLIQLPARFFQRVSVLSSPFIEWAPEGDAGVVDIYPASFTSDDSPLMVNLGTGWKERYNVGAMLNVHPGKFHVVAKYNYRKELRERSFRKKTTNANGAVAEMNNNAQARPDIHLADILVGYDFSPKDKISFYGMYYHMDYDRYGKINNKQTAADGTVNTHIYRHRNNVQKQNAFSTEGRWKHLFNVSNHSLEMIFNYNNFTYDEENRYQNERVENGNIVREDDLFINHTKHNYYTSLIYQQPFAGNWLWKSGYTGRFKEETYEAAGHLKGADGWNIEPSLSHAYTFRRQTHLFFTSLRKEWEAWYIEPGVQVEYQYRKMEDRNFDQFRLYPRMSVGYDASMQSRFSFNYQQRTIRPIGSWLSSYTDKSDATHIKQGNPDLKDELIHSFELSYIYADDNFRLTPVLYYRNRSNRIMEVLYEENSASVWRKENMGHSNTLGGEISTYWRPVSLFSWNFSLNVYRDEIDGRILGSGEKKLLVCSDFKTAFRFFITNDTELQLDGFYISDQLTPQGKIKSHYTVNAGVSQYFMDRKLRANLSIQNIFDTLEEVTIIDTAASQVRQERNRDSRMVWLSLSYDL